MGTQPLSSCPYRSGWMILLFTLPWKQGISYCGQLTLGCEALKSMDGILGTMKIIPVGAGADQVAKYNSDSWVLDQLLLV